MLPAAITALFVYFKLGGRKPNPLFLAGFWVLLLAYLAVRFSLVPTTTSGYQEQQLRQGRGVLLALMDYLLPAWNWFTVLTLSLSTSWILLLVPQTWVLIAQISGNALSWYATWKHPVRLQVVAFFAFGVLSFLPMAWLQPFGHYHYWPSAMRAVYFVCLAVVAVRALANAVSLPALQAPPRPSPAPGSLPRH